MHQNPGCLVKTELGGPTPRTSGVGFSRSGKGPDKCPGDADAVDPDTTF